MMSWKVPSLENPLKYQAPRWSLCLLIMVIAGVIGFGVGLYLFSNGLLPDDTDKTIGMIAFSTGPAVLVLFVYCFIDILTSYKYSLFSEMLNEAKEDWRQWAGEHIGVLTHFRLTQLDENNQDMLKITSQPPNKGNRLTLNSLKSLSDWEKQEKVVQQLLAPIAAYYHQHGLNQPITLYWQAENAHDDWQKCIQQEATQRQLPLGTIEKLPYESLSEWLLSLHDNGLEPKLYAVLAFQFALPASEEAGSLLLAPQSMYQSLGKPIKAKLLRPISTDIETFPDALAAQCNFQSSGQQLAAIWHSGVGDNEKGNYAENYAKQGVTQLSEHVNDIDTLFGQGGVARHVIALSWVCESPHHNLLVYGEKNKSLLQQVHNMA